MGEDLSSQADGMISPQEVVKVARKIGNVWKLVAPLLDAKLFDIGVMDIIKQQESDPITQAHRMLSKWTGHQADEATRSKLILALYHNDKRDVAQQVFGGQLVTFVVGPEPAVPACPVRGINTSVVNGVELTGFSCLEEPRITGREAAAPVKVLATEPVVTGREAAAPVKLVDGLVDHILPKFIIDAVLEHGRTRWNALGLYLCSGNQGKVTSYTNNICEDVDKLQAIIVKLKAAKGEETVAANILQACKDIKDPIYPAVIAAAQEMQRRYEEK